MLQRPVNARHAETSSQHTNVRFKELDNQQWDRDKSNDLAYEEDINITDAHWDVIIYLRLYYIESGLPRFARITSRALNKQFLTLGGSKYLYSLFPGGPVTQGSRLANLRTPPLSTDLCFGSCY